VSVEFKARGRGARVTTLRNPSERTLGRSQTKRTRDPKRTAAPASSLNGAEKLGLEQDLGSLERGKLADFVVLDANPLEDIHNSQKIRYVVKNGFVYDAASMTEVWPERKTLQRFFWMTDTESKRFAAPEPARLGHQ